ncbi:hypothetical protein [Mycobacterium sp. 1423905.2]|uniref:hypothetical protein n=1 Tax=Mycobacterium sp. 1423905.2 TaxID=1856859 RepID=UPI0012EAD26C|nr:hypothetical protein [Mycobacterium sp. 1423905.2]
MRQFEQRAAALPPVLRSRRELEAHGIRFLPEDAQAAVQLPIADDGTTFSMAQDVRWLDTDHFAVGRWDGSLDVFRYTPTRSSGPLIRTAVSSPSAIGVQMITRLSANSFVSSNDSQSMVVWSRSVGRDWSEIRPDGTLRYDAEFGVATGGDSFAVGGHHYLVVGHASGFLTVWSSPATTTPLRFVVAVDLQSAAPVNPFGLQHIHDVYLVYAEHSSALVVTASENGQLCFVRIPDGKIMSRTVFNDAARRGINSIAVRDRDLLVANCSVGSSDYNLWYFRMDVDAANIALRDRVDLKVNPHRPQAFNFCVVWARTDDGPCWFSSTEEGALWMGTADSAQGLSVIGYQEATNPLGSVLAFQPCGRLVMIGFNLYEFVTLNSPPA